MTELYMMHISEAAKLPVEYAKRNFPKRYERSLRFYRREDVLRCIAAGALETYVLGVPESEIIIAETGKPYLFDRGRYFSVSHSGDYAMLALSDRKVGVDIEKPSVVDMALAESVFTADELQWMNVDTEMRFFALWTMKESVLKLDGRGLSVPMKSFSVLPLMQGVGMQFGISELFGTTGITDGHVFSACSESILEKPTPLILIKKKITLKAIK